MSKLQRWEDKLQSRLAALEHTFASETTSLRDRVKYLEDAAIQNGEYELQLVDNQKKMVENQHELITRIEALEKNTPPTTPPSTKPESLQSRLIRLGRDAIGAEAVRSFDSALEWMSTHPEESNEMMKTFIDAKDVKCKVCKHDVKARRCLSDVNVCFNCMHSIAIIIGAMCIAKEDEQDE